MKTSSTQTLTEFEAILEEELLENPSGNETVILPIDYNQEGNTALGLLTDLLPLNTQIAPTPSFLSGELAAPVLEVEDVSTQTEEYEMKTTSTQTNTQFEAILEEEELLENASGNETVILPIDYNQEDNTALGLLRDLLPLNTQIAPTPSFLSGELQAPVLEVKEKDEPVEEQDEPVEEQDKPVEEQDEPVEEQADDIDVDNEWLDALAGRKTIQEKIFEALDHLENTRGRVVGLTGNNIYNQIRLEYLNDAPARRSFDRSLGRATQNGYITKIQMYNHLRYRLNGR
ncbi:unnamed protein product [Rotaria socialis]|uniref:Uncharacterized protein n=1 Tax=Rotaria socialis TaxID=392032 RepID=A0A821VU79_9BILA|nr:unnamed protein product [Rotaria socialis]CAF4913183.1 unnamed protein product [Rotaria socialis]